MSGADAAAGPDAVFRFSSPGITVEFEGPDEWLRGPEVERIEESNGGLRLFLRDGADHHPILERAVASGARILRFDLVEPRLHEIFVRHAGDNAVGDSGLPERRGVLTGSEQGGVA